MNSAIGESLDDRQYTSEQIVAIARVYEYLLRQVEDDIAQGGEATGAEIQATEEIPVSTVTTDE